MTTETLTPTTEPRTAPLEPTTPIRPSEAIRLGCLLAPVQAFGTYGASGQACALGAMALGFGAEEPHMADGYHYQRDTPGGRVMGLYAACPDCGIDCGGTKMYSPRFVPHLNDAHRWSRERIADWLEGLGL